jgi:transposase
MARQRIELITGTERRRRFSDADKLRLVAEAFRPGAVVIEVARRHQVDESLLYRWRRLVAQGLLTAADQPSFVPVQVAPEPPSAAASPAEPRTSMPEAAVEPAPGVIEIELPRGGRVRITGAAEPATVAAALRALLGR